MALARAAADCCCRHRGPRVCGVPRGSIAARFADRSNRERGSCCRASACTGGSSFRRGAACLRSAARAAAPPDPAAPVDGPCATEDAASSRNRRWPAAGRRARRGDSGRRAGDEDRWPRDRAAGVSPAGSPVGGRATPPAATKDTATATATTAAPPPAPAPRSSRRCRSTRCGCSSPRATACASAKACCSLATDGSRLCTPGGGAPILSLANSSLNGIFYARSKQPRWRDASGQTVESKSISAGWVS